MPKMARHKYYRNHFDHFLNSYIILSSHLHHSNIYMLPIQFKHGKLHICIHYVVFVMLVFNLYTFKILCYVVVYFLVKEIKFSASYSVEEILVYHDSNLIKISGIFQPKQASNFSCIKQRLWLLFFFSPFKSWHLKLVAQNDLPNHCGLGDCAMLDPSLATMKVI
ncbi:hypothetical protein KFK09_014079 [Dendrobium nobile]|uniref:Uncharacterized protein n=1 Tax=Dendrobium nobile TaxID=94219 RepID=A0A8T3BB05_DENNO|nr:hypothetical protein KFK09_014079 [Dendrobium nobile]